MPVRVLAGLVGVAIIGAVAYSTIQTYGGIGSAASIIAACLAAGLIVGAAVVGRCWRQSQTTLAILIGLACICGEAYSLIVTADRVIAARDERQAPLAAAEKERAKAVKRVDDAMTKAGIVVSSPRLTRAEAAKARSDAAAIEKSAERGCASNCRILLEQQVREAQAEVEAARKEIEATKSTVAAEIERAKADLTKLPPPATPAPLADRLGVAPWVIDVVAAALASIAANGLGAFLVAFAAHGRREPAPEIQAPPTPKSEPLRPVATRPALPAPKKARRDAKREADQFARDRFRPSPDGCISLRDIRSSYHEWCASKGISPLSDHEIAAALNGLFSRVGLKINGQEVAGISWAEAA
jgi:hypothetical protein